MISEIIGKVEHRRKKTGSEKNLYIWKFAIICVKITRRFESIDQLSLSSNEAYSIKTKLIILSLVLLLLACNVTVDFH